MIPKQIHFFWLSGNPYDKTTEKCIKSWHQKLPDYEIKKWTYADCAEIIKANTFASEALSVKKWAFVTDYLRLYVLYNFGGIYMDADVEVVKKLDSFLGDKAFTCYEADHQLAATLIGAEKNNSWIKILLDYYNDKHFINPDGSFNMQPNSSIITDITSKYNFNPDGKEQRLDIGVHIYTKDYFCPIDLFDKRNDCYTSNTCAIHLFNGSWQPRWRHYASLIKKRLGVDVREIFGEKMYSKISSH